MMMMMSENQNVRERSAHDAASDSRSRADVSVKHCDPSVISVVRPVFLKTR